MTPLPPQPLSPLDGRYFAAVGPLVLGVLYDGTGGWTWPLLLLLGAVVPMAWAGWGAARDAVLDIVSEVTPAGARTPAVSSGPAGPAGPTGPSVATVPGGTSGIVRAGAAGPVVNAAGVAR